jgi:hypothetical protein
MSLKAERNKKKIANKARKGFKGHPLATIAYYGPTDKKATKVTVSIIAKENADPEPMKSWFSEADVRNDGCPHQEGIDYPDGEVCQECTFWKGRDRWTGERIH